MARKDTRLFARLDLDYADHPKISRLSDAAFRAHVEMILYARKYKTDGIIPERFAKRVASEALSELLANDEESPSLIDLGDGTFLLHGYADMNETREEIERRSQANSENGRRGGIAKAQSAKRVAKRTASKSLSEKGGENVAETETETETDKHVAERADARALCDLLADLIEGNGSKRPTIGKTWLDAAHLMIDKDKRDVTKATNLIRWSQESTFWKATILSMPKFREQYDKLRLQALREHEEKNSRRDPDAWMNS